MHMQEHVCIRRKLLCGMPFCSWCRWTILFREDQGQRVTLNGVRYRETIDVNVALVVENQMKEFGFQQEGATRHTESRTIELLQGQFGDYVISRHGPVTYPARSCDLTPCDFFTLG